MTPRFLQILVLVAALSSSLVACGGDGPATTDGGTAGVAGAAGESPQADAETDGAGAEPEGEDRGSGPGGSSSGGSAGAKEDFIRRADAICARADDVKIEALTKRASEEPGVEETPKRQEELLLEVVLPPVQKQAEELAELRAPAGDEREFQAFARGIEEAVSETEADPGRILASGETPFEEINEWAAAYGFRKCSAAQ